MLAFESNSITAVPATSIAHQYLTYRPRPGLSVPAITVLDSAGRIVEAEQRRVYRYNIQQGAGADIIFGIGTNGEWNRITNEQRQQLIRLEADEVRQINLELRASGRLPVEAWVGVTAATRAETLSNLACALQAGADAAIIAPLSIVDLDDVVGFFQREVTDLLDQHGLMIPIFLYDNADIAVNPSIPHLRTRQVKRLSRLPFIQGIKVSAPRRVLGNYTKAALHFKDKGEFGIYVGNAMLIFDVYRLEEGWLGKLREYWNRYLLHNELPIGVISGPANVLPREWKRAWRACYSGDEALMAVYQSIFTTFENDCVFHEGGRPVSKMIACLKYALKLKGIIENDAVGQGTPALTPEQRQIFQERFTQLEEMVAATNPLWISQT